MADLALAAAGVPPVRMNLPVPLQRQDEIVNLQPAIVQTKEGSTTSLSEPISVCFLSLQIFYLFLANVDI